MIVPGRIKIGCALQGDKCVEAGRAKHAGSDGWVRWDIVVVMLAQPTCRFKHG